MDLSLKGSQMNLVSRQSKGKLSTVKGSSPPGNGQLQRRHCRRPSSATICSKRSLSSSSSLSSLQQRRPQSADATKCYGVSRRCSSSCNRQCCECDFLSCRLWKSKKRYQSVSSSNLLKLLLDEPIKRSWLCRDSDIRSTLTKRASSCTNLVNQPSQSKTNLESTKENQDPSKISPHRSSISSASTQVSLSSESSMSNSNNYSRKDRTTTTTTTTTDFCWPKTDIVQSKKADLAGRVSFGKFNLIGQDNELSDCENDGSNKNSNRLPLALKKSVHFDRSSATALDNFEYPKCPSEKCSCKTASPAATVLDDFQLKCPGCKSSKCGSDTIESDVIRDYKNSVKSMTEDILKNDNCHSNSNTYHQQLELSFRSEQLTIRRKTEPISENPKNLSEKSSSSTCNQQMAKCDLVSPGNCDLTEKCPSYRSSSEAIIDNYLKVTSSDPGVAVGERKKKQIDVNTKNDIIRKTPHPLPNHCCLPSREDSNLNEFHLDKVDSWMSLQKSNCPKKLTSAPLRRAHLYDDLEKFSKDSIDGVDNEEENEEAPDSSSCKSIDNSQDDSTYDEIVSVIKEIEEDKKKENCGQKQSELELKLNTTDQNHQLDREPSSNSSEQGSANAKSLDKYKDILNYLDDVEDNCDKTLLETRRSIPESNRSEIEFVVEPDIAEDVPKLSDLLMLPNHQLARRVIALSLRANELANALHLSKEHVAKVREENQKIIRMEKSQSANKLRDQKKHYETIVTRHQGFIEQLLKDKGSLCEKVAALTRRLESQNQAWEHKLEAEVARAKELTMAGEKVRRERWVRENTKKIKELTVKGLEMEINKMNANHQKEISDLKRAHQQELLTAIEEARQKHDQIENTIRESCAQDREAIIEKERNAIRERFERQLEEERRSFDEQKAKLCEDFHSERQRMQAEMKSKDNECQTKRLEVIQEKDSAIAQVIAEMQEKFSKEEDKYQNRINAMEKQYEADFEIWKKEYENSCKMRQVEAENNIRQHYRVERDRQIDEIVCRMDAEALKQSEEFEMKINRLKEKYEKDLSDLECVEKSLREKYTEARSRAAESDAQVRNLQAENKQIQIELEHSKKMCNEILTEREQLRENIRTEVQTEAATLRSERDNEIQRIHKRVQQAIEKKDATIELLQKENGTLRERCIKLEAIIRQQRKDYCVK